MSMMRAANLQLRAPKDGLINGCRAAAVGVFALFAVIAVFPDAARATDTLTSAEALRLATRAVHRELAPDATPYNCARRSRIRFRCQVDGRAGDTHFKGWIAVWNHGRTRTRWRIRVRVVNEYCQATRKRGCARTEDFSGEGPRRSRYPEAVG